MSFYAVANGKEIGIYNTWEECKNQINGFSNAKYKKFKTREDAENFILDSKISVLTPDYYVYTDGACTNNGKVNAKAGIGIYFGKNDPRNVSKRILGKQTNNVAELTAIIETYPLIKNDINNGKLITIVSDSEYAIKCATYYGKRDGNFPNKDLVKKIYDLYGGSSNITFKHCRAHTNNSDIHSLGNAEADKLASLACTL